MLHFSDRLRNSILESLKANFNQFIESTLKYVVEAKEFNLCAIETISRKSTPFEVNIQSCIDFILDSKGNEEQIIFNFKIGDGFNWRNNEIRFPFLSRIPEWPQFGTPEFDRYREWRNGLEYSCQDNFWTLDYNKLTYLPFKEINIFDNKIIEKEKLSYYENNSIVIAKDKWLLYIKDLVRIYLPEFEFSERFSTTKVKRYLIEISEDLWFGFEYDETDLSYDIRKGIPVLPDFFNLVLLNSSFKRNEKKANYYYQSHSAIISLGILGNPFLYQPCYPMIGYEAIDSYKATEEGRPYKTQIVPLNSTQLQLIHSDDFNESMKRHAFFYMHLLSSTAEPYLTYLRKALLACCS